MTGIGAMDAAGNLHDAVNGEFAGKANAKPRGALQPLLQGTFLFPPAAFESATELVRFFEEAPVSDRVLSNADYAFVAWREQQIVAAMKAEYARTLATPRDLRKITGWQNPSSEQFMAAMQQHLDETRMHAESTAFKVRRIDHGQLRPVLVGHQILTNAWRLPAEEKAVAEGASTEIAISPNPGLTRVGYRELCDFYSAGAWAARALTESDLPALDATTSVARTISERERELALAGYRF